MKRLTLLLLFFSLIKLTEAQVPGTLSYQGLLVKTDGTPVSDGNHTVKFDFYIVATAGTAVLSRGPFTVTTYKGMLTFILGSGTPTGNDALPEALGASQHYIEVIADGVALTPRAQLTTVPYAIKAQSANTMDAAGLSGTIKVNSGNVGIGTTTPNAPLQLANEIKNRKIVLWEDGNNDHGYYGFGINGSMLRYQVSNVGGSHAFYSGASVSTSKELLRITGAGNVGIGTPTPAAKLNLSEAAGTVNGAASGSIILDHEDNGGASSIVFRSKVNRGSDYGYLQYQDAATVGGAGESARLILGTSNDGDDHIAIMPAGKLGIGTLTPTETVQISDFDQAGPTYLKLATSGVNASPAGVKVAGIKFRHFDENYGFNINSVDDNSNAGLYFLAVNNGTVSNVLSLDRSTGNVGIGTVNPLSPLHVVGTGIATPTLARAYFNVSGGIVLNTSSSGNILVRADGYFWASGGGYVATSDARIKNVLRKTNTNKDLKSLMGIEITDYKYIDVISNGDREHKKVIAQQLQEVYPTAVNVNSGVIPNVFETAKNITASATNTIIETIKPHHFSTGDEVKLILEKKGEKTFTVIVINEHEFSVNELIDEAVFVYGRKVDDLLIVDYDALTTLNISATQELSKQFEKLQEKQIIIERQQERIQQLEARVESLASTISTELEIIKMQFSMDGKTPPASKSISSSISGSSKK